MIVVGVDLAWGTRNNSGLCLARDGGVVDSGLMRTDAEILTWIADRIDAEPCLLAIDAPLVVPNAVGRRPCERVISRWMGARHAGAHSSNSGMPAFATGPRGARIAAALGCDLDPYPRATGPARAAIEVYPHPALVELFGLARSLPYKAKRGRTRPDRLTAFGVLLSLLEALRSASPELEVERANPRWSELRSAIATSVSGAALDRAEDELDAYVCAYVGLHHRVHGPPRSRVIGSLAEGYIVTPCCRADGRVDAASQSLLDAVLADV